MPWGVALRSLDPRLLLIPVTIAASAGDIRFAPPEGQKFRHLIVQEREDGEVRRRFTSERIVEFRKSDNGYLAELVILRNTASAGQSGAMFIGAADALRGRTISLNLDREGKIISIIDEMAIWNALNHAIDSIGHGSRARRSTLNDYASSLRAQPAEQQRSLIASLITPLIARPIAVEGDHAISLPARAIDGAPILLAGTESVRRAASGMIVLETTASGAFPSPLGRGEEAHILVTIRRTIDPRTGLVLEASETRDSWIGANKDARHSIARTTATLSPVAAP